MTAIDIRRRTGYLFAGLVVGHLVLISAQASTGGGVPILESATVGVFAEVQRLATGAVTGMRSVWTGYFALRVTEQQNLELRQEIAELELRLQEQRAVAQEALSLERLLDLRMRTPLMTEAAAIIAGSASPEFRTVTINKGTVAGVSADMAVIAPAGVVGRVVQPAGRAAQVQLLVDRNAAVGVMLERTRVQGIAVGTGEGLLRLDYIPGTASVAVGDLVVTSGSDGIYPKGFIIGQIETAARLGANYSLIQVRPAVNFATLEAVLVVTDAGDAAVIPEDH